MRITAVTCVKNEGPFLLEWIAYNRLIGVNAHLFYSNDCTDGTDLLLDALAARGLVHHLPNPAEGRNYQMEALKHAQSHPSVRGADWVWVADVDEFLNIHVGDHTIDALIDDGFFEQFDTVLFYGAGPGGYAACAYSVSAPGARVLAVQPQATLDPRIAEWDGRFAHMRRTDFSSRYGYAPDMVDAAEQAILVYDPAEELDAMHVALFTRANVVKLRMRFMGTALQGDLWRMNILMPSLLALAEGRLDHGAFARLYRRRREYGNYLRSLLGVLDQRQRPGLTVHLCRHAVATIGAPRFRRRLEALQKAAAEGQLSLPPTGS
ncbi:MAG: glycosyltransferase family 2 protein [Lutimaribacter sp.]